MDLVRLPVRGRQPRARIIARAKRYGIGTVYIKSGDGGSVWSQFTSRLVEAPAPRRARRLRLAVRLRRRTRSPRPGSAPPRSQAGADCLVIDAEGEYEGKYAAADRYIRALRARIGADFPVSLAGFPYVDYHPAFPYSVFFGPGGAHYNQPQMYWKAIGTSVRAVYEHTYLYNRLWGHPIYPLGQTYDGAGQRSRSSSSAASPTSYGGLPPSWWDWQETNAAGWRRARRRHRRPGPRLPADHHATRC